MLGCRCLVVNSKLAYSKLNKKRQIKVVTEFAKQALIFYHFENVKLNLIQHEFNTTYWFKSNKVKYLLRVGTNSLKSKESIKIEHKWLSFLQKKE